MVEHYTRSNLRMQQTESLASSQIFIISQLDLVVGPRVVAMRQDGASQARVDGMTMDGVMTGGTMADGDGTKVHTNRSAFSGDSDVERREKSGEVVLEHLGVEPLLVGATRKEGNEFAAIPL